MILFEARIQLDGLQEYILFKDFLEERGVSYEDDSDTDFSFFVVAITDPIFPEYVVDLFKDFECWKEEAMQALQDAKNDRYTENAYLIDFGEDGRKHIVIE